MSNRLACWLWSIVFWRWLRDDEQVTHVLGWRKAEAMDDALRMRSITPIFWWFK